MNGFALKGARRFLFRFICLMIGCENSPTGSAGMSDAELIDAIRSASKVDILMNDMPSQSQSIIENDNEYDGCDHSDGFCSSLV